MGAFTEQSLSMARNLGMTVPIWKALAVIGFLLIWNTYPRTDNPNRRRLYTALQTLGVLLLIYLAIVFRDGEGRFFRGSYGILGSIGWAYLFCAVVYLFVRNNIPKIFFFWLAILLFLIARSSPPQLIPRDANILSDLIGIVRVSSTTLLTMGGVLFSLLIVNYSHLEPRKKAIYLASLTAVVLVASIISHQYWIVAKLGATIPWVLYCSAITIGTYGLLHWLVVKGKANWFNVIKAGGTATLSCYVMPYFLQGFFYSFNYGVLPGSINSLLPDWVKADFFGLVKCALWALLCIGFTALLQRYKVQLKI
jgi:hypothetical protein